MDCGICHKHHELFTPLDVLKSEIRLLVIKFGFDDEETVSCHLESVSLDAQPNYHAVSYVWGNPEITESIIVNGHKFNVTLNLFNALRKIKQYCENL